MARWDDVLLEKSRLLLHHAEELAHNNSLLLAEVEIPASANDEGHDTQIPLHHRWHFPRALRWWTHRGESVNLAG